MSPSSTDARRRRWRIVEHLAKSGPDEIDRALRRVQRCWGIDDGTIAMVLEKFGSDAAPGSHGPDGRG
jgi:hypothetical protein